MSRSTEGDEELPYGFWEHNLEAAFNGKKGQQFLKDIEQALLAMSVKELHADVFIGDFTNNHEAPDPDKVCVLGAYARYKSDQEPINNLEYDYEIADWMRAKYGMTRTMALQFVYYNDELFYSMDPAERYERMLNLVRRKIK